MCLVHKSCRLSHQTDRNAHQALLERRIGCLRLVYGHTSCSRPSKAARGVFTNSEAVRLPAPRAHLDPLSLLCLLRTATVTAEVLQQSALAAQSHTHARAGVQVRAAQVPTAARTSPLVRAAAPSGVRAVRPRVHSAGC